MEGLEITANATKALYDVKKGPQIAQNHSSAKSYGLFEILF